MTEARTQTVIYTSPIGHTSYSEMATDISHDASKHLLGGVKNFLPALESLLQTAFSQREIHGLFMRLGGDPLVNELPPPGAALAELAHQGALLLQKRGFVQKAELFDILLELRPLHGEQIEGLRTCLCSPIEEFFLGEFSQQRRRLLAFGKTQFEPRQGISRKALFRAGDRIKGFLSLTRRCGICIIHHDPADASLVRAFPGDDDEPESWMLGPGPLRWVIDGHATSPTGTKEFWIIWCHRPEKFMEPCLGISSTAAVRSTDARVKPYVHQLNRMLNDQQIGAMPLRYEVS